MPLDPAAQAMLDVIATEGHPPVEEMTADEARAVFAPLSLLQGDAHQPVRLHLVTARAPCGGAEEAPPQGALDPHAVVRSQGGSAALGAFGPAGDIDDVDSSSGPPALGWTVHHHAQGDEHVAAREIALLGTRAHPADQGDGVLVIAHGRSTRQPGDTGAGARCCLWKGWWHGQPVHAERSAMLSTEGGLRRRRGRWLLQRGA